MLRHENRSRKVTMGFKPSIYNQFQKIAHMQSVSPTQILAVYMEQYVKQHQELVEEYNRTYEETED